MFCVIKYRSRWRVKFSGGAKDTFPRTFPTEDAARAWAERCIAAKRRYRFPSWMKRGDPQNTTLADILSRYRTEITSQKKGASQEAYKIGRLMEAPISSLLLADLTPQAIATYRNERLQFVSDQTVRIELILIRRAIEQARREWNYDLPANPAALITLPKLDNARTRRLEPGEYESLRDAVADQPLLWALVRFAIGTAMRRGEILGLAWKDLDLANRFACLTKTKNGDPRTVPLSPLALQALADLPRPADPSAAVFPFQPSYLRTDWARACAIAGIEDLRFHDLRREGVSRLFEFGALSPPEVAMISGHKTVGMLYRYVALRPTDLARKLEGMTSI